VEKGWSGDDAELAVARFASSIHPQRKGYFKNLKSTLGIRFTKDARDAIRKTWRSMEDAEQTEIVAAAQLAEAAAEAALLAAELAVVQAKQVLDEARAARLTLEMVKLRAASPQAAAAASPTESE
jgi:hypothetical protein